MAAAHTLLVIEDQEFTRDFLGTLLRQAGYEAILVSNGEEALALLSGLRPDLILLDMLMPVLDGWSFLEQFKTNGDAPIPIILMTATVLTREWAEDHGCCGFIRKPIEANALLEEIRRCLAA